MTEESTCHGEVEDSKMDVVTKRTPKSTAQRKKRKQELGPQELEEMLGESHPDKPVNIENYALKKSANEELFRRIKEDFDITMRYDSGDETFTIEQLRAKFK
ncbi:Hypothetical predicted protein [Paramuricea clavata]|uniref:Uncharacterized protein n=1 Tax=Paramuricea clavata TaxID=317549 RepID=A0A6S7K218_PARCT|nr:Hypothetical predicted protein [Paramuricea clavata]